MELPVVCTDALAGNVLDGKTGLVAALRDPVGLADRLERLAGDPELRRRLGKEGRRRAAADFRLEDQIAKFSDWYRALLAAEDNGYEERALRIELRRTSRRLDELEFERQRLARDIERRESAEAMTDLVEEFVPEDDHVLVVSRGDPTLLEIGRAASHFPQSADGGYLGHHPASSAEAIAQLEELRERDAAFLIFPRTALWWLEHYRGLRDHLERCYLTLAFDNESGAVFELRRVESEAVARRDVA
jgi:hypothetical protein